MTPLEVQAQPLLVGALEMVSLVDQGVTVPTSGFARMLDGTDPSLSVGVFFMSWVPVDGPSIGGWGEPTVGRYVFGIQTFLKSSERAEGERLSAIFVKRVRQTLYRDASLAADLGGLSEVSDDGSKERYLRHGIVTTDYADGSITGGFAFLSQSEFFIETEVA